MNPAAPADLRPVDLPVVRDFMTTHQTASLQENCKLRIASRAIAFVPDLPLNDAAALLVAREVERLRLAELYHVSAEMTTLAVGASKTMPDFGLARADMPSDYGLMVFATPIAVDVPEGEPHLRISAVSWGLWSHADSAFAPDGAVWVTLWSDTWDMFGDSMGDMIQQGRMSQAQLTAVCQPGNRLTCRGEFQWPFAPEISADDESLKVPAAGVLKCAWLLMQQQTIAESREEHLPKSGRRKLADRSPDLMRTRVITLRRGVSEGGHSGSHREYLSRWVVRGHWRQQWYAHRGVHRPIWIAPHIKGPEGAPILGGEKVYAWSK